MYGRGPTKTFQHITKRGIEGRTKTWKRVYNKRNFLLAFMRKHALFPEKLKRSEDGYYISWIVVVESVFKSTGFFLNFRKKSYLNVNSVPGYRWLALRGPWLHKHNSSRCNDRTKTSLSSLISGQCGSHKPYTCSHFFSPRVRKCRDCFRVLGAPAMSVWTVKWPSLQVRTRA